MSPAAIAGVVILLVGAALASDYKTFGMKNGAAGVLVAGVGFFLAVYGFLFGKVEIRGRGRRVKDHSI